jgi:hypothetical protein
MTEGTGYLHTLLIQLFLVPCQVTLVISSTRLYRALANFSSPVNSYDISSIQSFFALTPRLCHCSTQPDESTSVRATRSMPNSSKHSPFARVPSSRVEVTVHKAYEEHAMTHTNHFSTSYPSSDGQLHDKPHEISFDDNHMDDHAKKQVDMVD